MTDHDRTTKIDAAVKRGGKPLVSLAPGDWALVLGLLDGYHDSDAERILAEIEGQL